MKNILQLITLVLIVGSALSLIKAVYLGLRIKSEGLIYWHEHKKWIDIFTTVTVCAVVSIECLLQLGGAGSGFGNPLLLFHLICCVAPMLALFLAARLKWTGLNDEKIHRKLVRGFILFYILTATTGTPLLYSLYMK